jgi:hypothetical protein
MNSQFELLKYRVTPFVTPNEEENSSYRATDKQLKCRKAIIGVTELQSYDCNWEMPHD